MAAPSGTTWGSTVSGYARIGLYITTSNTNTQTKVTVQVWFWSKYSVDDSINNFYFDWDKTSASTNKGDVNINTTVDSGAGWSTSNQQRLATYTKTYNRGTSAQTKNCAAALSTIEAAPGTMRVSKSFSVPALASYKVTYNANGGSGAPGQQTKYYGQTLKLSSTKPTRSGYNFKGWATSSSAESAQYQPGGNYTSNANVTLYAVWEVGTLVEFETGTLPTITIPDTNGTGNANVPSVQVPITVSYESPNANSNVYYRVCYSDTVQGSVGNYAQNSLNTILGPTKANAFGSNFKITLSSELIKKAIIAQQQDDAATFVVLVCTGANTFENTLTSKLTFTLDILNFKTITGELFGAWWQSSSVMKMIVEYTLPKSYTLNGTSIIVPTVSNNGNTLQAVAVTKTVTDEEDCKRVRYSFTVTSPVEDFSHIDLTDGLSTGKVYVRIVPYSKDQSIKIYKSTKTIEAIEFIEHSTLYGFQRGGRVYFPDFTEKDSGDVGAAATELLMYEMKERE